MRIVTLSSAAELETILPLVEGYRTFYGLPPDDAAARAYLPRFLGADAALGRLLAAWPQDAAWPVGYACVHWRASSYLLREEAYLSDLYVASAARGAGAGAALLDACVEAARSRDLESLSWITGIENRTAQRLYERYPADRSAHFEYELPV